MIVNHVSNKKRKATQLLIRLVSLSFNPIESIYFCDKSIIFLSFMNKYIIVHTFILQLSWGVGDEHTITWKLLSKHKDTSFWIISTLLLIGIYIQIERIIDWISTLGLTDAISICLIDCKFDFFFFYMIFCFNILFFV